MALTCWCFITKLLWNKKKTHYRLMCYTVSIYYCTSLYFNDKAIVTNVYKVVCCFFIVVVVNQWYNARHINTLAQYVLWHSVALTLTWKFDQDAIVLQQKQTSQIASFLRWPLLFCIMFIQHIKNKMQMVMFTIIMTQSRFNYDICLAFSSYQGVNHTYQIIHTILQFFFDVITLYLQLTNLDDVSETLCSCIFALFTSYRSWTMSLKL